MRPPGVCTETSPDRSPGPSHLEFARKSNSREIYPLFPTSSLGPAPSLLLRRRLPGYRVARAVSFPGAALSRVLRAFPSPVTRAGGTGKATPATASHHCKLKSHGRSQLQATPKFKHLPFKGTESCQLLLKNFRGKKNPQRTRPVLEYRCYMKTASKNL